MDLINILKKISNRRIYDIGFIDVDKMHFPYDRRNGAVKWLDLCGYHGSWFADPFILSDSADEIELLAEEYILSEKKGRISYLRVQIVNGQYYLRELVPSLDLSTHLSFPYIFRDNGKIYVCPENKKSGGFYIYEYMPETHTLANPRCQIKLPLVDAAIIKKNNGYYIIGVTNTEIGRDSTRSARVFHSDALFGEYQELPALEYQNLCIKRGAGAVFEYHGLMIRPTQYCENSYGEYVVFNSLSFDNGSIEEFPIGRLELDYSSNHPCGVHTFNFSGSHCVIDGKRFKYPMLHRISKIFDI